MKLKLSCLALSLTLTTPALAGEWEIKNDLKYTDGITSDVTEFEDDGEFDKRKIKKKRKTKTNTLLTYSQESAWSNLDYQFRVGHIYERVKEHNIQRKEDGSLRKDKSLTEIEQITYAGIGLSYKQQNFLGADLWTVKAYYDHILRISYEATDLKEDADDRSGSSHKGYIAAIRASGEYSTPLPSLYLAPFLRYKEEYKDAWHNDVEEELEDEEREEQYRAGLFFNWITPTPGLELIAGPYWEREIDFERKEGEDWESDDAERWIARLQLEYEAASPGLEMEFFVEQDLNGEDDGETVYNFEISYEF